MSGGHFSYDQYKIEYIREEIEKVISENDSKELDRYGDAIGFGFAPEIIQEFKNGVDVLNKAFIYAHRIDYLLSGDDGTDSFTERLNGELKEPVQLKQFSELATDYTNLKLNLKDTIYSKLDFIRTNSGIINIGEFVIDTDLLTLTGYVGSSDAKKECGTMSFHQDDPEQAISDIKNYIVNAICT